MSDEAKDFKPSDKKQTRMILVTLQRPVALPISLLDAINLGGIENISALDEPMEEGTAQPMPF